MNAFQALKRLEAWKEARPLPRGTTLHFPLAKPRDSLGLAFVRMGGESAPWGIAWGFPGKPAEIRSVPEPRDRDAVAKMVCEFAPTLLGHICHPEYSEVAGPEDQRPLRQIWLPNVSHVDMLHHLAFAYTFARKGDPERIPVLNAFGRAVNWLFREFNRPGQVTVMAASDALKESFTFPCEDLRQGHLGYLLAWLEAKGPREARLAATSAAERRSISTSLDPALERTELSDRVERFGEARREGRTPSTRLASDIAAVLRQELEHRLERTMAALELLRSDPRSENPGVAKLVAEAHKAHWHDYLRTEREILDRPGQRVFIPSPETDTHPATAAAVYFLNQGHEDQKLSLLLEHDAEMQAEALASGRAIEGTIRGVRDERVSRKSVPVWKVEVDGESATTLRKGKSVLVAQLRRRKGRIRDVAVATGRTIFTIEITDLKTVPRRNDGSVLSATDPGLVGRHVVLLPDSADGIHTAKRRKLGGAGAPGGWLTDARPAGRRAVLPDEVAAPVDELPADRQSRS